MRLRNSKDEILNRQNLIVISIKLTMIISVFKIFSVSNVKVTIHANYSHDFQQEVLGTINFAHPGHQGESFAV